VAFPVFFDTNVVFGGALNDVVLTLAERGLYRPLWSVDVLAELRRNLIGAGIDSAAVDYRIATMRSAFPDAEVTDYSDLTSAMTNEEGDRHVLAAAVRANAEVVVTFNLRHFPSSSLAPYEIEARHPDGFLLDQLDLYEALTISGMLSVVSSYERPPMTIRQFIERLQRAGVPRFAARIERLL
jgi:hypothetical protein